MIVVVHITACSSACTFACTFACTRVLDKEKATKWYTEGGEIDGLTTNGILLMHPPLDGGFSAPPGGGGGGDPKPSVWREVSVEGGIYALRESRSTPQKSSLVRIFSIMYWSVIFADKNVLAPFDAGGEIVTELEIDR